MNSFFIKYKLYHLPFWVVYHFCWWTLAVGSVTKVWGELAGTPYLFKTMFYVVFQALGVYLNLYVLIPKLLEKRKFVFYILGFVCTTVLTASLIVPGYFLSASFWHKTMESLYGPGADTFLHFFRHKTLPSTVAAMTLGMSVKLTKQWIEAKTREQKLETEKLETELKFLKSQINPHFLFNTINTIFVLINKNQKEASTSLLRFSDLLRYQLYECNEAFIPLANELEYMQNYIELEKLRHEKSLKVEIDLPDMLQGGHKIAPFILMPFVENAFKHVSKTHEAFISISVQLSSNELYLVVKNAMESTFLPKNKDSESGIGLKNVQRRLDLIYPDAHTLNTNQETNTFEIELKIKL